MSETPRDAFAAALAQLVRDADITYRELERWGRKRVPPVKLGYSKISQWLSGQNVPRSSSAFKAFIAFLEERAKRKSQVSPRGVGWWETQRQAAERTPRADAERTRPSRRGLAGPKCRVGFLPRRAAAFQDRSAHLPFMGRASGAAPSGGIVLSGIGGVGKSQLAAHHVRSVEQELDVLVWVTATSRDSIVAAYAEAGVELCGADPADPERAAQRFMQYLDAAGKPLMRWLIVLDNLLDPADLNHESGADLLPPINGQGQVLITTRRREVTSFPEDYIHVTLPLFDATMAVAYLDSFLSNHGRHEPTGELTALAAALGYLPLALAQSASYLITAGVGCAEYRREFTRRKLEDVLPDRSSLPDGQTETVATTWSLSVEYANRLPPVGLAGQMLNLTAMLAPEGIPRTVLSCEKARDYITSVGPSTASEPEGRGVSSVIDCTAALRALHRLCLIDYDFSEPAETVRVHQLVQHATREALTQDQFRACARAVADAVTAELMACSDDLMSQETLRSNALHLMSCANESLWSSNDAHPLLLLTGSSFMESGFPTAAKEYFVELVEEAKQRLGERHVWTRRYRLYAGDAQMRVGDTNGAVATLESLKDDFVALRAKSSDISTGEFASVLHHLADAHGENGNPQTAVKILTEVTKITESEYAGSKEFLSARHDLARWLSDTGELRKALEIYTDVLDAKLSLLGSEDPETLVTQYEIARMQALAGRSEEAVEGYASLLSIQRRVLGNDHPETIKTMEEIARTRAILENDANIAVEGLEEALDLRLRIQEASTPIVLHTRMDLNMWRHLARVHAEPPTREGFDQDVDDMTSLIADMEEVLSPGHPMLEQTLRYLKHIRKYKRHVDRRGPEDAALRYRKPFKQTTVNLNAQIR